MKEVIKHKMTTITQRKKLSKSAWALIFIALISVVAIIICASLGIIDLSPASNGYLSVFMWGSNDIVNALLLSTGLFLLGVLCYYTVQKYFIGSKVTTTMPTYTHPGQTISQQPQKGEETVISQ